MYCAAPALCFVKDKALAEKGWVPLFCLSTPLGMDEVEGWNFNS